MSSSSVAAVKRQSVPLPRPLQLSNFTNSESHSRTSSSISSASDSQPPSRSNSFSRNPSSRRQSSIAYLPHDSSPRYDIRSPTLASRSKRYNSVDYTPATPSIAAGDNKGTISTSEHDRPPLTLADKHADLLSFIAQKESKCMELRSQLAAHEAELNQLKKKWERIVNKGFDRVVANHSLPTSQSSTGSGTQVLDGIKEGVRLLASGLGEFSISPVTPISPRTHSTQQSISSVSSASTRLSLSSMTSSTMEDEFSLESPEEEQQDSQILIAQDIEPTPTVSPTVVDISSLEQEKASKILRRRSRDAPPSSEVKNEPNRTKQMTIAPISLLPGLGTFPPGTPSWVLGTVGKKWEELQRTETFTKSQKRASVLISDMSQSFMNAWSAPAAMPVACPSPSSRTIRSASSLLDDDVDAPVLGAVMTPNSKSTGKKQTSLATVPVQDDDDDEEWNW